jgi:GH18 family chitinase
MMRVVVVIMMLVVGVGMARPGKFREVGYIPWHLVDSLHMPDLGGLTHLNIAFLNPDSLGQFSFERRVQLLVSAAHEKGVLVLLSIGGGNPPGYLRKLLGRKYREVLVGNLAGLLDRYGCDGIDVDLEGDFIDGNYEGFVKRLAEACKVRGKLITAAVATDYGSSYTKAALAQYDFINIMSYDKTGPWAPARSGPHAPMSMAVDDLAYWAGVWGISKDRLTLGLPFYGYGFGVHAPESMSYGEILAAYPDHRDSDRLVLPGRGVVYYNGLATILAKTRLAKEKAGGIMIWQLLQDAPRPYSLLSAIDSVIER